LKTLGDGCFWECGGLLSVVFEDGSLLVVIGMECLALTTFTLGSQLRLTEELHLFGCKDLGRFALLGSVRYLLNFIDARKHAVLSFSRFSLCTFGCDGEKPSWPTSPTIER
jgi:hypothetical protein